MTPLPPAAEKALRESTKRRIFIAVPNMLDVNSHLGQKLMHFFADQRFKVYIQQPTEVRHHDHARNLAVKAFLTTDAEFLLFIDSDVDPHPQLLELALLDKPISAGIVHCWINSKLLPSVWERSDCEECAVVKQFEIDGTNKDTSRYRVSLIEERSVLERWNPFAGRFEPFRIRGEAPELQCRCRGTGKDPWTYRVHAGVYSGKVFQADSVGTAAMMIRRDVIETVPFPWFRFLYKESGEIMLTEDHYFTWKASTMGITTWCDPRLLCNHFKRVSLLAVHDLMVLAGEKGAEFERARAAAEAAAAAVVPEVEPAFLHEGSN